jgi:mRNA interferase RelE/StbE
MVAQLPPKIRRQVTERLRKLADNPRPQDVKMLRGQQKVYRVDSGEYRIVYEIDDEEKRVTVRVVKHRKDAYRNL